MLNCVRLLVYHDNPGYNPWPYVHDFVRVETSYSLTAELPKKQHTIDSKCILVTVNTEKKNRQMSAGCSLSVKTPESPVQSQADHPLFV